MSVNEYGMIVTIIYCFLCTHYMLQPELMFMITFKMSIYYKIIIYYLILEPRSILKVDRHYLKQQKNQTLP